MKGGYGNWFGSTRVNGVSGISNSYVKQVKGKYKDPVDTVDYIARLHDQELEQDTSVLGTLKADAKFANRLYNDQGLKGLAVGVLVADQHLLNNKQTKTAATIMTLLGL